MLILASAAAPEPPPPLNDTVGAVTYPDPAPVTVIYATLSELEPVPRLAVAVAVVLLSPTGGALIVTEGAEVYPLPPPTTPAPLVTITLVTPDPAGLCP